MRAVTRERPSVLVKVTILASKTGFVIAVFFNADETMEGDELLVDSASTDGQGGKDGGVEELREL